MSVYLIWVATVWVVVAFCIVCYLLVCFVLLVVCHDCLFCLVVGLLIVVNGVARFGVLCVIV